MSKLVYFDVGFSRPCVSEAKSFIHQESLAIECKLFCMRGYFKLSLHSSDSFSESLWISVLV